MNFASYRQEYRLFIIVYENKNYTFAYKLMKKILTKLKTSNCIDRVKIQREQRNFK